MTAVELRREGHATAARLPACTWFTGLHVVPVRGDAEVTTADEEACVLLLSGTFDLVAGATHWGNRGARNSPLVGRPSAVYLPPRTMLRAGNGDGELLVIKARQQTRAAEGRAALHQKPLLPLAGSGKAFDPDTGEWLPAEMFPSSAELLPPRRMPRTQAGPVTVEHVFPADYKAATLTVAEAVLPAGRAVRFADLTGAAAAVETLVFVRGDARLRAPGEELVVAGDAVAFLSAGDLAGAELQAGNASCYLAIAHAGKSPR